MRAITVVRRVGGGVEEVHLLYSFKMGSTTTYLSSNVSDHVCASGWGA